MKKGPARTEPALAVCRGRRSGLLFFQFVDLGFGLVLGFGEVFLRFGVEVLGLGFSGDRP